MGLQRGWLIAAIVSLGAHAAAQEATLQAYGLAEKNALGGTPIIVTVWRDGARAVVDRRVDPAQGDEHAMHVRTYYDLLKHQSVAWNMADRNQPCTRQEFSGDWGDPFAASAEITEELKKANAKQTGTELIKRVNAAVWTASTEVGQAKIWLDPKYNLLLQYELTPKSGPATTLIEVQMLSLAAPTPSILNEPAHCATAALPGHVASDGERIALETGDSSANYELGINGPPSKEACSVSLRVVAAGTMQQVAKPFQIAMDLSYNPEQTPAPHYVTGVSNQGHTSFSGGAIQEMTSQVHDGVLRVENFPPQVYLELVFPDGGESGGTIYRHCAGAHTELLYVVKDPGNDRAGGEFLWVKGGKYAGK